MDLKNLFRREEEPKNLFEQLVTLATPLISNGYRKLALGQNIAPTIKTSDQKIIEIYQKVGTAFREVSNKRNEQLSLGQINAIVFKFLQVYELAGDNFLDEHLNYEIEKYNKEGLREDYKVEIKLF